MWCVGLFARAGAARAGLDYSRIVLDRHGKLLRAYADKEGRWRLPATPSDVDPRYLRMLFAYEDKRFYDHDGVDVLALARAAYQLVSERTSSPAAAP